MTHLKSSSKQTHFLEWEIDNEWFFKGKISWRKTDTNFNFQEDWWSLGIINKEIEIKKGDVPEVYVKVDLKTVDAEKTADGKEAYLKKKITELKASDEFIKEKSEKVFETPKEIELGEKEITKKS